MARYDIYFKESVWKDVKKIPGTELRRILSKIEKLADDPRLAGCEKLTEHELYRVRQGSYRIVYSIQDDTLTVWVIKIGHRKDVYHQRPLQ
jgi:mRNA interferase RelE/StbE